MITFRLPFRRRQAPTPAATAERVTAYLANHPDSSSRDIAFGLPAPWSAVSTALGILQGEGRVTGMWTHGPVPRQFLYRLAGPDIPKAAPRPDGPRSEPSHSMLLDRVVRTLVRSNGRTTADIAATLEMTHQYVYVLLHDLRAAGRVTQTDAATGPILWRLALPPIDPPPAAPAPDTTAGRTRPQPWRAKGHP